MSVLDSFHPAVRTWFERRFAAPTEAQTGGWPEIVAGRDTLISAPTGSGKTLAAFLVAIDRLLRRAEQGPLDDAIEVIYASPLKALSNDIQRNLEEPLAQIAEVARELGYAPAEVRTVVRTGDTTQAERQGIVKRPPHILITTPESLYLMLTADRSREVLRTAKTVIVDEVHALIRDKRGSHLALSLARLDHVCKQRPARIGLSATIKPIEEAARFLVGMEHVGVSVRPPTEVGGMSGSQTVAEAFQPRPAPHGQAERPGLPNGGRPAGNGQAERPGLPDEEVMSSGEARKPRLQHGLRGAEQAATPECVIVNAGHQRDLDLALEVPPTDLEAVCSSQQWGDIYDRLAELVREHRTTLIFVNTRRLAERVAHSLAERLGEEHVASHHGSLSKERRLALERRLKAGEMKALVATASLELGIDIGTVDLVCQLESPRAISTFLQRVGRSGHALGLTPKGRLFPTTRDELVECAAMVRAVRAGRLDRLFPPAAPLDILAQQIVAECACEPWAEDSLYDLVRRAWPYASLDRRDFDEVVELMSEGIQVGTGKACAYLHRDRMNRVLRGRRGARMAAIESGGAIPEVADYRVLAEPDGTFVGTLDEDFAVESMAGDIFLLGTTSWRIRRIEQGTVRVEDAHGLPPTIPFWLGEAPARTFELSQEVSSLRSELAGRLEGGDDAVAWLSSEARLPAEAAEQVVRYVRAERDMLGVVPTHEDIVFERFFDDSGGMQLVVHAPFGGRVNRGLGLALRKNFCRTFDFELQAAASDDAVLLSISPQHSFPLDDMFSLVRAHEIEETLTQALLYVPMFGARWRWNATRALAVPRQRQGKRVPPPIQRMRSDDLLAAVFPAQVGCQENVTGPLELPDHPLVRQTVHDCLHEAMDLEGLRDLLQRMERGEVRLHSRDTTEPSPFAHEMLNSKPYTYLDDAPLEERRARAVTLRRTLPENARDLGALDADAIERVRQEASPDPRDAEEVHDALLAFVAIREEDVAGWRDWFDELIAAGRAATVETEGATLWSAAENLPLVRALYRDGRVTPSITLPPSLHGAPPDEDDALVALLRGHMECLGPATVAELARRVALSPGRIASGLARLEGEGAVLRGRFRPGVDEEFCDRRLLARIHRATLDRLRREIEPVSARDYLRFLLRWQHVAPGTQLEGKRGLLEAVAQLQGFEAPVVAWERYLLPARVANYRNGWLDELCLSGDVVWGRLSLRRNGDNGRPSVAGASSATPVSLVRRADLPWLVAGVRNGEAPQPPEHGAARDVLDLLHTRGALFYDDIVAGARRLPSDVERGLWELVARGLVTADGFQALRSLMAAGKRRSNRALRAAHRTRPIAAGLPAGRWAPLASTGEAPSGDALAEAWAEQLLFRYGVVFRDAVQREELTVPWREVLRALRRMEARGVARGGRFVAGFYGEQYARPEAVEVLRRIRRKERDGEEVVLSAVDPLNLAGILTPGARVTAIHTNALLYRDGLPEAVTPRG